MTTIESAITQKALTIRLSFEYHEPDFPRELLAHAPEIARLSIDCATSDQIQELLLNQTAQWLQKASAEIESEILAMLLQKLDREKT
jgi:hypothetical protein